jgi:hypothetical protein
MCALGHSTRVVGERCWISSIYLNLLSWLPELKERIEELEHEVEKFYRNCVEIQTYQAKLLYIAEYWVHTLFPLSSFISLRLPLR